MKVTNVYHKLSAICQIAYQLVGDKECGDDWQIELDTTFRNDPSKCSKLVFADKRCGEYYEVRRDKNMCRCIKAERNNDCKFRSDSNTVLYRIEGSMNKKKIDIILLDPNKSFILS